MIRSASPTSGPESYPAFIGCDDGSATERALCETTEMAARSATLASAATALSSVPGPAVMISGRSAFAIHSGKLLDRRRIGMRRRRHRARHDRRRLVERRRQRLARQHQIDRPARRRHRDLMRARHHVGDLARHAQLVVPLHDLAHHAGLVEHLLAPVDLARARAEAALLGDRRAPSREDQRHAVAREVDQVVDRVPGADIDVHHHGLRPPGLRVGAVRHRDREIFVRHQHGARQPGVAARARAKTPRRSAENPCPDWRRR